MTTPTHGSVDVVEVRVGRGCDPIEVAQRAHAIESPRVKATGKRAALRA
jgi:hypothetical protein